jgi:hypothetical protein
LAGSSGKKLSLLAAYKKSPFLSYFAAEACNRAKEFPVWELKAKGYVKERGLMKALKN